jgi:hypothetical protein
MFKRYLIYILQEKVPNDRLFQQDGRLHIRITKPVPREMNWEAADLSLGRLVHLTSLPLIILWMLRQGRGIRTPLATNLPELGVTCLAKCGLNWNIDTISASPQKVPSLNTCKTVRTET